MNLYLQSQRTLQVFAKIWKYLKLSDRERARYRELKKRFTRELLRHLNFRLIYINQPMRLEQPVIYVCNHIGFMDIPVLMNILPEASFISKAEVAAWPLIGTAAQRIETIFVKRQSKSSRQKARQELASALLEENKKIVVFPSGTTSITPSEKWKKGVFEIAAEHGIPVIPVRLHYTPLRELAYIDKDNFMVSLFQLTKLSHIDVRIEFHEPFYVKNPTQDCERVKSWCEEYAAFAAGNVRRQMIRSAL